MFAHSWQLYEAFLHVTHSCMQRSAGKLSCKHFPPPRKKVCPVLTLPPTKISHCLSWLGSTGGENVHGTLTLTNERHSQDNERHSHQTSYCKLLRFTLAPSFSKLLNLMQPEWCLTNHLHSPCSGQQRRQPRRTPPQLSGLHCGFALCTAPGQTHAKHRSATHPSFTQATAQPHFCYVIPHPVFSLVSFFTNTTIAQITE